jgi:hypothetical protein
MGGDCKSPGSAFEGSNPSPATNSFIYRGISVNPHTFEGSNPNAKRSGNWNSPRKYEGFSISVE